MRILVNTLLLVASVAVSLLAAEGLARVAVEPLDYLWPALAEDDFLFYRVEGNTGGHDAWGNRNPRVPDSAEIVCIGDSMTYGVAALARDSFPRVLGRITGKTVYNMGIPGYGPIQYLYLMRNKAVTLHPKTVIVGFYLGNDLIDVYNEVRFNKNWSVYGKIDGTDEEPVLAYQPRPGKFLGETRDWLSRHSVLYGILRTTSVIDFFRELELRIGPAEGREEGPDQGLVYRDSTHNVAFFGHPFVDLNDPKIKSGMQITRQVLLDMRSVAEKNGFRLIVGLIPTKQRVYSKLLERAGEFRKHPGLADEVHQEDAVRNMIVDQLNQDNIEAVDLLPALQADVEQRDPYPHTDGHPSREGYRVIAEAISRYLKDAN